MNTFSDDDRRHMAECLELATRGAGQVSPNPLVGCVIERAGTVLSRGWHAKFGGLHAEADALRRLRGTAMGATMIVNMEPCNHHGKTPPCTEAIIEAGIARVVVAMRDPNSHVTGHGILRLRGAGIAVELGLLREEAEDLNRFFLHWVDAGTPWVTVKLAQSLDGKIAAHRGTRTQISDEAAQQYVHGLRATYDAVAVGAETVRIDRPRLTVRATNGRDPVRVVLDAHLRAPYSPALLDGAQTIVYTSSAALSSVHARSLLRRGATLVAAPARGGKIDARFMLRDLGRRGIASLLVEGGSAVATDLLARKLVNEMQLIVAPRFLGGDMHAFGPGVARSLSATSLRVSALGGGALLVARFPIS